MVNKVDISDQAVRELFSDWSGPVGAAIDDAAHEVADIARQLAPVGSKVVRSKAGTVYSYPGRLKELTRVSAEHHYDNDGFCLGLVGAPRYPYNFLATPTSHKGFTRNRGGRSVRPAADDYLRRALELAPPREWGAP